MPGGNHGHWRYGLWSVSGVVLWGGIFTVGITLLGERFRDA